jgi:DUF4097 and DUF4098 domain-containing protein YvlB
MKILSYGFLMGATLAFNVWAFGELSFDTELSIPSKRAKEIFIDVGSGSLNVSSDNVNQVIVNAKVYSNKYHSVDKLTQAFKNKMEFTLDRKGSTIVLKALNRKSFFGHSNAEIAIDLDIVIPKRMNVEIDDGSGDMWVTDIGGTLEIDDGSGATVIDNIADNIFIDDGSGNLTISNVYGSVTIDDGSGKIIMNNIQGDVSIDDGSGEVSITQVTGDVKVDDSSGSITVNELAGHFTLVDDGSGSVHVK